MCTAKGSIKEMNVSEGRCQKNDCIENNIFVVDATVWISDYLCDRGGCSIKPSTCVIICKSRSTLFANPTINHSYHNASIYIYPCLSLFAILQLLISIKSMIQPLHMHSIPALHVSSHLVLRETPSQASNASTAQHGQINYR